MSAIKKFPLAALIVLIITLIAAVVYDVVYENVLVKYVDEPVETKKTDTNEYKSLISTQDTSTWQIYSGKFFSLKYSPDWVEKSDPKQSWIVFGPKETSDYYIVTCCIDLNKDTAQSLSDSYGIKEKNYFSIDGHHAIFLGDLFSKDDQYPFEQIFFIDNVKEIVTDGSDLSKEVREGPLRVHGYAKTQALQDKYSRDFNDILSTFKFTPLR